MINYYQRFLDTIAKFHKHDIPLGIDTPLLALGIDSLATISLLVEIEAALDIHIPDEALSPEAFDSVGALWKMVDSCIGLNNGSHSDSSST
jgi:acyl carrier protein